MEESCCCCLWRFQDKIEESNLVLAATGVDVSAAADADAARFLSSSATSNFSWLACCCSYYFFFVLRWSLWSVHPPGSAHRSVPLRPDRHTYKSFKSDSTFQAAAADAATFAWWENMGMWVMNREKRRSRNFTAYKLLTPKNSRQLFQFHLQIFPFLPVPLAQV